MKTLVIFADGGSRGNPGPAAGAFALYELEGEYSDGETIIQIAQSMEPVHTHSVYLGHTTNNVAEWNGVLHGVQYIVDTFTSELPVWIFLDSELVVKQIRGEYKVKQAHLKPIHAATLSLLKTRKKWGIQHIYRNHNAVADSLVNAILDAHQS